ncbi:MAG TPA: hypothetical protein ENK49_12545 [Gammaproteobacteria bacterium]|nr:hypothetical protein [Gammaproteobacteria bacterium]
MTKIITVAGAAGGVGKTRIATGLATRLVQQGQRVGLLDADPAPDGDRSQSDSAADQYLVPDGLGFDRLPLSPDRAADGTLQEGFWRGLDNALTRINDHDCLIVDTSSCSAADARAFAVHSSAALLVVTPEPEVIGKAWGLFRQLHQGCSELQIGMVINKSENQAVGEQTYTKFKEVAGFYLGQEVPLLGVLGDAGYEQEMDRLAERLWREWDAMAAIDLAEFASGLLRSAGLDTDSNNPVPHSATPSADDEDLQQQLEGLNERVEELIAEVENLRSVTGRAPEVIDFPQADRSVPVSRCADICFAVQSSFEEITVQGETISIYRMRRANGDPQRFACHSPDDDIQEPEPQSTSS